MVTESCTKCGAPLDREGAGRTLIEIMCGGRFCWKCTVTNRLLMKSASDPREHCECHLPVGPFPGGDYGWFGKPKASEHAPWCKYAAN